MNKQSAIASKWIKTQVLVRSSYLAAHIPTTLRLNRGSLAQLLKRYQMVYVKPVSGSCGIGVMRVEKLRSGWGVREGKHRRTFATFDKLCHWLDYRIKRVPYLVQRGVHMLSFKGRPIDFRVVIQKGEGARWRVTGMAGRVAHPLRAVTNGSQGGSIFAAQELLIRTTGRPTSMRLLRQFNQLARVTSQRLSRAYPRMNELGLDIAVDRRRRAWVLEVNTRPDPCPFTKLANPAMIRTMVRYARGYGRTYCLRCNKARRGTSSR